MSTASPLHRPPLQTTTSPHPTKESVMPLFPFAPDYDDLDFETRDELDEDAALDAARFREAVLGDLPARPGVRR